LKSIDSVAYIHILYAIYILQNSVGGGGGLYRLQLPRDGGGAADARATGRQERRAAALEKARRRWRRAHCVMRVPYWYK
jgi:hypothetical protein